MLQILLFAVVISGCGDAPINKSENTGRHRAFSGLFESTKQPPIDSPIESPLRLKGHTWSVNSVTFSPDGTLLATGGRDGLVCLWSLPSGQLFQNDSERFAKCECGGILPGWKADCDRRIDHQCFPKMARPVDPESLGRLDFTVKIWNTDDSTLHRALAKPDVTGNIEMEPGKPWLLSLHFDELCDILPGWQTARLRR